VFKGPDVIDHVEDSRFGSNTAGFSVYGLNLLPKMPLHHTPHFSGSLKETPPISVVLSPLFMCVRHSIFVGLVVSFTRSFGSFLVGVIPFIGMRPILFRSP